MLNESEKAEILKYKGNVAALPEDLKEKLRKAIKNNDSPFDDGDICCDTGTDAGTRYQQCSRDTCVSLGWTVVSDSNCS